jgi:hypothetical protein
VSSYGELVRPLERADHHSHKLRALGLELRAYKDPEELRGAECDSGPRPAE